MRQDTVSCIISRGGKTTHIPRYPFQPPGNSRGTAVIGMANNRRAIA